MSIIKNKEFKIFTTELGSINFKLDSSINDYDKDFRRLFNALNHLAVSKELFNKIKLAFIEKNREQKSTILHQEPRDVIASLISEKSPYQIDEKEVYAYSYKDFSDFIKLTSFDQLITFIHGDCDPEILQKIDNLLGSFSKKILGFQTFPSKDLTKNIGFILHTLFTK